MFPLLKLPEELFTYIFTFIPRSDLKIISCCSRMLYDRLKKTLWSHVKIRWKPLLTINWRNTIFRKQLANLQYTISITFYDEDGDLNEKGNKGIDDFSTLIKRKGASCNPAFSNKILLSCMKILDSCKKLQIESFSSTRGGEVLIHACQAFPCLKRLHLPGVTDVYPRFRREQKLPDVLHLISQLDCLEELDLSDHYMIIISDLPKLVNGKGLEKLRVLSLLEYDEIDNISVHLISNLSQLKELSVRCFDITYANNSLDQLVISMKSKQIQNLCIQHTTITDQGILALLELKCLLSLDISHCRYLSPVGLEPIASCGSLKRLISASLHIVTDKFISLLPLLNKLQQLSIRNCPKITAACLPYIMKIESLEFLDISYNGPCFSKNHIQKLNTLSLKGLIDVCGNVSLGEAQVVKAIFKGWRLKDTKLVNKGLICKEGFNQRATEQQINDSFCLEMTQAKYGSRKCLGR